MPLPTSSQTRERSFRKNADPGDNCAYTFPLVFPDVNSDWTTRSSSREQDWNDNPDDDDDDDDGGEDIVG
jgi:hypothetical protein